MSKTKANCYINVIDDGGMSEFNCSHYYWSKAFPLYGWEYGSVVEAIEKMEKELPGYFYAGNQVLLFIILL